VRGVDATGRVAAVTAQRMGTYEAAAAWAREAAEQHKVLLVTVTSVMSHEVKTLGAIAALSRSPGCVVLYTPCMCKSQPITVDGFDLATATCMAMGY
jgi:hypothetical protein